LLLPAEDPFRIREELSRNSRELHIPYKVSKKKHPLIATHKNEKKKRIQVRFIRPRKTQNYHLRDT